MSNKQKRSKRMAPKVYLQSTDKIWKDEVSHGY